eukprot:361005-Chlamydomonas_euryale.AAC.13
MSRDIGNQLLKPSNKSPPASRQLQSQDPTMWVCSGTGNARGFAPTARSSGTRSGTRRTQWLKTRAHAHLPPHLPQTLQAFPFGVPSEGAPPPPCLTQTLKVFSDCVWGPSPQSTKGGGGGWRLLPPPPRTRPVMPHPHTP